MPADTYVLGRIGELFAIDAEVAPRGPTGRVSSMPRRARRLPSNPRTVDISVKSTLIRYTTDGRLEMSDNAAERAIHPPFLGRKNSLRRLRQRQGPQSRQSPNAINRIDELLPWNPKPTG
jgi:Transposase IS66 family